jgi:NAD binding domain of 6-phosphogluconate dehydrogenase
MMDAHRGNDGRVAEALAADAVWAQMGTIGLDATARLAGRLASLRPDVAFVDAPVSGSKGPAESGQLLILASGPRSSAATSRRSFRSNGRSRTWTWHWRPRVVPRCRCCPPCPGSGTQRSKPGTADRTSVPPAWHSTRSRNESSSGGLRAQRGGLLLAGAPPLAGVPDGVVEAIEGAPLEPLLKPGGHRFRRSRERGRARS